MYNNYLNFQTEESIFRDIILQTLTHYLALV